MRRLGPYNILSVVGRGSTGTVYRALDPRLDREVALKVLTGATDGPAVARFLGEARAIAKLRHRNVVSIHEANVYAGLKVIVLELVPGGSLSEKLRRGPLPPRAAARIVSELARGVDAAHRAGILHRDLKPGNVLLSEDGTPLLTDFGLAVATPREGVHSPEAEAERGYLAGSPAFMAPEQLEGQIEKLGHWTDVWGLGAILHTALAGKPPFGDGKGIETFRRIQSAQADPIPGLPTRLDALRKRALSRSPGARFGSAAELADALDAWQATDRADAIGATRVSIWRMRVASLVGAFALLILALALRFVF
jgi:serine/threonine-protein kinase